MLILAILLLSYTRISPQVYMVYIFRDLNVFVIKLHWGTGSVRNFSKVKNIESNVHAPTASSRTLMASAPSECPMESL